MRREPGRLVLLGVVPTQPEIDYGWLEVGDEIGQEQGQALCQVSSFWEKPSLQEAQMLCHQGYLWNTMVVVGVSMFVTLFHQHTPTLLNTFESLQPVLGSRHEVAVLSEIYAKIPHINFSQAILVPGAQHLAVLPVEGVYWSDWGDPRRLLLDLARFAHQSRQQKECAVSPHAVTG